MQRVFAIADLHLPSSLGKTMDRFGAHWENHPARIAENARRVVSPGDLLLLPGDLSWALKRAEARDDLHYLAGLPGIKVAIKGNHDYWWDSKKPIDFPGLLSPPQIFDHGRIGIAGTRGWFVPEPGSADEKQNRRILERERARLRVSLLAIQDCPIRIAMTHYPPFPFVPELTAAGIETVVYGHIHLSSPPEFEAQALNGERVNGIRFYCVAADRVNFTPYCLVG